MKTKKLNRLLMLIVAFMTMCVTQVWGATKTGSWDLTSAKTGWTATGNATYFSQPYGYKAANGTLTNKSISDLSTSGITQIKVGFKCLQNGATTSKLTIYLVDKDGNALGSGVQVTPVNASAASNTTYQYATFKTGFTGATGFMMKVTTFTKNILVNGASYEITYTDAPATAYTVTFNAGSNGTCSTSSLKEASAGAGVMLPNVTAKTGYRFVGWSTSSTPTSADAGEVGDTYKPSSNCQLYAYYIKTWDVKWYVNGTPTIRTVDNGSALSIPDGIDTDIECGGKVFVGWCTAASYSNPTTAPTGMFTSTSGTVNADANYYAVYATKSGSGGTATGSNLSATTSAQTLEAGKPITYTSSAANSYSNPVRVYKGGTLTIAGATMTKIVLDGDDSSNPATNLILKAGGPGSISTGTNSVTWTGSATSVTFVASSAQARVKTITVTYGNVTYSNYTTTCGPETYTASIVDPKNGSIK